MKIPHSPTPQFAISNRVFSEFYHTTVVFIQSLSSPTLFYKYVFVVMCRIIDIIYLFNQLDQITKRFFLLQVWLPAASLRIFQ